MSVIICYSCCIPVDTDFIETYMHEDKEYCENCYEKIEEKDIDKSKNVK